MKQDEPREKAVARLLSQYGDQMYRFALRLCGNPHDAQDLVQETFLKAYKNWKQFDGRSKVTTWLYTIAVRTCGRMRRKKAGEPGRIESIDELLPFREKDMPDIDGQITNPAELAERGELRECMEKSIAALPAPFRMPLILKDILELPIDEVAEILGLKPETVKTRLHRARLKLRRDLTGELPCREGSAAAYPKQVCLDLLHAKQEALDRGITFPVGQTIMCERCRNVFASLDLTRYVCGGMNQGRIPKVLLDKLRKQMEAV
ncbi:MAG: RNA polymerase sigma factor [Verrucomicrobia bacterium]|nr:RNA polymerase sigma factor [Verrucomicrobiota bacterium]